VSNIYKGVGINFGVSSSVCAQFGTFTLQSRDIGFTSETELIKNSDGNTIAKVYFDQKREGTFEYIPLGASGGANAPTLPAIGDVATVTDSVTPAVAWFATGSNWLVDDVQVKSSNTSATRVTVKMTSYPLITS